MTFADLNKLAISLMTGAAILGCVTWSSPASAANCTTMPLGDGWTTTTCDDGTTMDTMPLGDGWSSTDIDRPEGQDDQSCLTMPLGDDFSSTDCN